MHHLHHLEVESARFVEAIQDVPPSVPVPAGPDCDADDLLSHLGEFQWFSASTEKRSTSRQHERAKRSLTGFQAITARTSLMGSALPSAPPPHSPTDRPRAKFVARTSSFAHYQATRPIEPGTDVFEPASRMPVIPDTVAATAGPFRRPRFRPAEAAWVRAKTLELCRHVPPKTKPREQTRRRCLT